MALTFATQQGKSLSSNSTTTWDAYRTPIADPLLGLGEDLLQPAVSRY